MASPYDPATLLDVSGLVAVVTGGGTGLGLTIARTLASNGATVYITGRRPEKLEEAASAFKGLRGIILPIQGSTTSRTDLQRAVDHVSQETGYIDLLVANAGMTTYDSSPNARPKPTPGKSSIADIRDYYFNYRDPEVWRATLETNVASVFTTAMAFLELLEKGNQRRRGEEGRPTSQIVVVGSTGGLSRFTDSFIYNASKAAVHHLAKNLGAFLVPYDIRTNIIAPGWFPTDMTVPFSKMWESTGGVLPKELVPQQRMGKEEDLAGTMLFLASKAGAFCNGETIVLDGGFLHNHSGS